MLPNYSITTLAFIDWSKYVPSIITLLGGGGFLTAIILLLKARPEVGQIVVTSAQGAVIVQTGVIDNLNKELKRVNDENAQLRDRLNREIKEREALQDKLDLLEDKLRRLSSRTETLEGK